MAEAGTELGEERVVSHTAVRRPASPLIGLSTDAVTAPRVPRLKLQVDANDVVACAATGAVPRMP